MSDRFRGTPAPASADLSAIFVSDGAEDKPGIATIVGGMGAGALRFPAVLVPEGAVPPGYPFVEFGQMRGDGEPGSPHRNPTTERGLHAHRSSTHARSQTRPARGVTASGRAAVEAGANGEARAAAPAGAPPAVARDPHGRLHDDATDAISAALNALAVPPAYDSLPGLVDLAMADSWSAGLPRGCYDRERRG